MGDLSMGVAMKANAGTGNAGGWNQSTVVVPMGAAKRYQTAGYTVGSNRVMPAIREESTVAN